MEWQRTISTAVNYDGVGLHSAGKVSVMLRPAGADEGITFVRTDVPGEPRIQARVSQVVGNDRGTTLGTGEVQVATVEHIMAAFSGLGIDNVLVLVDGEELPAGDGSASPWVELIRTAGISSQEAPRRFFAVKEPFWIHEGDKQLVVLPNSSFKITYMVDFPETPLKSQFAEFAIDENTFTEEIAPSRTFGFLREVKYLQDKGLIQGGSLNNAVVINEKGVVNEEGLRFVNEPVRHKILDLMGDLYLLGRPLRAHIVAVKAGHLFHVQLAQELEKLVAKEDKKSSSLSIQEIEKILPHRYPFLLVDRIVSMDISEGEVIGIKNFTIDEPFFVGHFPGHPVVPACLLVEAMAQVGGVYLLSKSENQGKLAYFTAIDKARFRRPVVPGDQFVTRIKFLSLKKRFGRATGKVEAEGYVDGKRVTEAVFLFSLVER